jgi:hypothetical protein
LTRISRIGTDSEAGSQGEDVPSVRCQVSGLGRGRGAGRRRGTASSELDEGKVSCLVLRGRGGNTSRLPGS